MSHVIEFADKKDDKSKIVDDILHSLPAWFGIEQSILDYMKSAASLPMVVIRNEKDIIGFCSLKINYKINCDLYVLGIKPSFRNNGLGTNMLKYIEQHAKEVGCKYLSVKTLSESSQDKNYAMTRLFYENFGFIKFEEMPELWDENNPCLYMIKPIKKAIR